MNYLIWSANPSLEDYILKQYLIEFPEDVDKTMSPIKVIQRNDRVVLFAKVQDGYELITFKNCHNGYVEFGKSMWYSSYEHALGDCFNFLDGVILWEYQKKAHFMLTQTHNFTKLIVLRITTMEHL